MENDSVNLLGASGHARVILDILHAAHRDVGAIFDQDPRITALDGYPVHPQEEVRFPLIISIGDNRTRAMLASLLRGPFATATHPSALISPSATLGAGSVVMQGAILQAGVRVGAHVIINTGASVDHECRIGDFAHISPHATLCGNVRVGEGSHVGAGAILLPGVVIGNWCRIGAGSVVLRDVPDGTTVAGVPALPIHSRITETYLTPSRYE